MIDGVARLVGLSPEKVDYFQRGDLEIYRVDPPLCGYRIIAAATSPYAVHAQYIDADGKVHGRRDDPVSTTLYGVANEALQVHPNTKLTSADGSYPHALSPNWDTPSGAPPTMRLQRENTR
ncbi:hypothetical protein [Mycobacterium sp. AZCC_0083]|uniref:hypothetical protein n=1 Tax=Mycobacterium sp. AZCC_0083 TaxID=2735882 RepID=UPI00161AD3D8|nr:hypothetical protein [Mycobacterium sp. AZCC_0083]MBB5164847.1 hypothetical protein [Mycobacterium sp. AZCC_0083]